jgi:hypothetical protein
MTGGRIRKDSRVPVPVVKGSSENVTTPEILS